MEFFKEKFSNKSGQSLIEMIIGLVVGMVMIGGIAMILDVALRSGKESAGVSNASLVARELADKVSETAKINWADIYDLNKWPTATTTYYIIGTSTIATGSESVVMSREYVRYFTIENVNRDKCGIGDIVSGATTTCAISGGAGIVEDKSTQKINIFVSWDGGKKSFKNSFYATRISNFSFVQNDWTGGSGQDIFPISSSTSQSSVNSKYSTSNNINFNYVGLFDNNFSISNIPRFKKFEIGTLNLVAIKEDNTVWTWGWDEKYSYGHGDLPQAVSLPQQVSTSTGLLTVEKVSANNRGFFGITPNGVMAAGDLWEWSVLRTDGSIVKYPEFRYAGVKDASRGRTARLILLDDGSVYSTGNGKIFSGINCGGHGNNYYVDNVTTGVKVTNSTGMGTNIVQVAAGDFSNYALDASGTAWAWGCLYTLGIGSINQTGQPIRVSASTGLTNIKKISTYEDHTLALDNNGDLWVWGFNAFGEFGDGTSGNTYYYPKKIIMPADFVSPVADFRAGNYISIVLDSSGQVWTWGTNGYCVNPTSCILRGALGNGDSRLNNSLYPVKVSSSTGLIRAKAVAAGYDTVGAVATDGSLWVWGENWFGTMGVQPYAEFFNKPFQLRFYNTSGSLVSSTFDSGRAKGVSLNTVMWRGTKVVGTSVKIQIASANCSNGAGNYPACDNGTWVFKGPDGTSSTYYNLDPSVPAKINTQNHSNQRYIKYKVNIDADSTGLNAPRIDSIAINYFL